MRILVLSMLLAACSSTPIQPPEALFVDTLTGTGTAWPITETDFLTAWHVVAPGLPFGVTVDGIPITEIIRLPDVDGALLRVEGGHGHAPWPIDESPLSSGEELLLSGFGGGLHWWSEGRASGDDRISMSISPGDSGGPLRDSKGAVRGIVVGIGRMAQHHCWIVPIQDLMAAIRQHQSTPPAPLGQ